MKETLKWGFMLLKEWTKTKTKTSKINNNDSTNSNNRVIDIKIANEVDSDEDIYDASQPQKMFSKRKIIISGGGREERVPDDLPLLAKLDWLLFDTACCSEIVVAIFYWSFVYGHKNGGKNIPASGHSRGCHRLFGGYFGKCSNCNTHQASTCCFSSPFRTVLHNLHHRVLVGGS